MKNRERLRNMALFDLLIKINANLGDMTDADICVLDVLTDEYHFGEHCGKGQCKTCLNNWLNKEEEHDKNT